MGKLRFTLGNIVFYIVIGFSIFLFENLPFIGNTNAYGGLSNTTFTVLTVSLLLLYIFYYFIEHKKNKVKLDWILLLVFSIMFIWMAASIWTNKEVTTFTNEETGFIKDVVITKADKWHYTIELLLSFIFFYSLFFTFGKGRVRTRQFIWLPIAIMVGVFFISLSTIYLDFDVYKAIFTGGEIKECVQAFSGNENILGLWYLFGILAAMIVSYRRPCWWSYFLMYYFLVVMVFTSCVTSLAVGAAAVILFTLVEVFARFKWNWRLAIILIFVLISVVGTVVGLYFLAKANNWKVLEMVKEYFNKYILNKDTKTFSNRTDIWNTAFSLLGKDISRFMFGYGYRTDLRIFVAYFQSKKGYEVELAHLHSSYVTVILRHGILGIIGYGIAIIYFYACCIKLFFKKNFRYGFTYALTVTTMLVYCFFEQATLFEPTCIGLMFTVMLFLPPIWTERTKRNKVQKALLKTKTKYKELSPMTLSYVASFIIFSLLVSVSCGLLTPLGAEQEFIHCVLIVAALFLVMTWMFYPYLLSLFKCKGSQRRFTWQVFLWTLFAIVAFASSFIVFTFVIVLPYKLVIFISLSVYLVISLTSTLIYSLVRKGNFMKWAKSTFYGVFVLPGSSLLLLLALIPTFAFVLPLFIELDALNLILILLVSFVFTSVICLCLPNERKDKVIEEVNDASIVKLQKLIRKDRI